MKSTLQAIKQKHGTISVGFISLGCSKNLVDSQNMAGVLLSEGVTLARAPEEADVIIVNTCSFIEAAREESLASIREACELKKRGPCKAVLVAGCFPQRYRERLQEAVPEIDGIVGVDQVDEIGGIVRRLRGGERGVVQISIRSKKLFEPKVAGLSFTGGPFAYIKVSEGCNHRCTFCAIPGIRGNHRSRPVEAIVREAEQLLERGVKELNLVSQDTTWYGRDLEPRSSLSDLIEALGRIGGDFWIRLLYLYPSLIDRRLLETIAATPQVCRYFDVPIQHSHPDILLKMRRGDTSRAVADMPEFIRSVMPDAALRTTCLIGFPGETRAHFDHLVDYLRRSDYDHVGAFAFSPEEGTPAPALPDPVPADEANERCTRLMEAQKALLDRRNARRVGSEDEVLIERMGGDTADWRARSRREAPEVDGYVWVTGAKKARPGEVVRVRFTGAADYDMKAEALLKSRR